MPEAVSVATPFSSLWADPAARERILDLSDLVELRRPEQAAAASGPALYHCDLSLVARWDGAAREELARVAQEIRLLAVSFHLASRYQDNLVQGGAFQGQGAPFSEAELRANAAANLGLAREVLGAGVELLVENNNDLGTDAYVRVTDPDFIAGLAAEYGLGLLWDVAHSRISARNRGQAAADYEAALGAEGCRQVHLSRPGLAGGRAFDAHDPLADEDWDDFAAGLGRLARLRWATIEYYRDADTLCDQLGRLRRILAQAGRAARG